MTSLSLKILLFGALALVVLSACGDDDDGNNEPALTKATFVGTWTTASFDIRINGESISDSLGAEERCVLDDDLILTETTYIILEANTICPQRSAGDTTDQGTISIADDLGSITVTDSDGDVRTEQVMALSQNSFTISSTETDTIFGTPFTTEITSTYNRK